MLSSNGISWRHGPHQLAQKLIITTRPLNCDRLTSLPPLAARVNCGAGPIGSASAGKARVSATSAAANGFLMSVPLLEVDGRTDARLEVIGELGGAQQAGLEHVVLYRHVQRQPVGRHHTIAGTKVHRELRI